MAGAVAAAAVEKIKMAVAEKMMGENFAGKVETEVLSLDANLAPLVVFLFMAGFVLFSSLQTGVRTTRVMVRIAKDGCRDRDGQTSGSLNKVMSNAFTASRFWAKGVNSLGGSLIAKPRRAASAIKNKISAIRKPKLSQKEKKVSASAPRWGASKLHFVKYWIPYRTISMVWGLVTRIPLPLPFMKRLVYQSWSNAFGCLLDEMRHPLEEYPNLCAFFLRPLKDGVRKVDMSSDMVCPVDGKVLHVQSVPMESYEQVTLEQVKGLNYKLKDFLGEMPSNFSPAPGRKLNTVVLYLSPGDYHHFHSACESTFTERKHFAGALLPVKPSVAHNVEGLYCINERVVLNGSWRQGFFSYVAVGALNVGSIEIDCDPELRTNVIHKQSGCYERTFSPAVETVRGEKVGLFNLGSTVVLVFESDENFEFDVSAGDVVRIGQRLDRESGEETQEEAPMHCPPWPSHRKRE